jgi:arylsulfatase A-like enzyme
MLALAVSVQLDSAAHADASAAGQRPHIVMIIADDLGWGDVGYHGSEIRTPHLDQLAASGVRLNRFYVQPLCTPTRASLLTGGYPFRYGLQGGVVRYWNRDGLPVSERLLSEALREAGYRTAIVGKWHLGHGRRELLPTKRGFEHQYGPYYHADYFTHTVGGYGGLDWHRNDRALREDGYTTRLIAREAVRLIRQHDRAQPLFLYVPFTTFQIRLAARTRPS